MLLRKDNEMGKLQEKSRRAEESHSDVKNVKPEERSKRRVLSTSKTGFTRKRLSHDSFKGKLCSICGAICIHKASLSRHMSWHKTIQRDSSVIPRLQEELNLAVIDLESKLPDITDLESKLPERTFEGFTPEDQKHFCIKCHSFYQNAEELKFHQHKDSGEEQFECTICGKTYDNLETFTQHRTYCQVKEFKCIDCDLKFRSIKSWEVHYSNHAIQVGLDPINNPMYCIDTVVDSLGNSHKVQSHQRQLVLKIHKLNNGNIVAPDHEDRTSVVGSKNNNSVFISESQYGSQEVAFHDTVNLSPKKSRNQNPRNRAFRCAEYGCECDFEQSCNLLLHGRSKNAPKVALMENGKKRVPTSNFLCIVCGASYTDRVQYKHHQQEHKYKVKRERIIPGLQEELFKALQDMECVDIPAPPDPFASASDTPSSTYNTCCLCLRNFKTLGDLKRHACTRIKQNLINL